ncbi:conserved hypothetical protein [Neorickettsia risticii str. Illinois]|uniref:Uncharacterized protein n=2 Tax=Neorickettsia risticii TaxID=950 RepID=C6V3T1_NEORI|nr:conserved hypothetical protein [Neorickettsia risticii str. Illinois]
MQKLKKKFATLGSMNRRTIKADTTAKKLPKEKPAKKIVSQNSGTVEKIITQKSGIAAIKLANQILGEEFTTPKPETELSAAPLRNEYEERPLPSIPSEYGDEDEIPFVDEEMNTSDLGSGVYDEIDEIASTGSESRSTKSGIGDSGIDDISVPDSAISNVDRQNETKSEPTTGRDTTTKIDGENKTTSVSNENHSAQGSSIGDSGNIFDLSIPNGDKQNETKNKLGPEIDTASETDSISISSVSTDEIAAYILSPLFKASKDTHDPLPSIKPIADEHSVQTGETSEQKNTGERLPNNQGSLTSTEDNSTVRNEAIVKRPALPEIFDAIYNPKWIKDDKSIDPADTNSISIKEQNKDSAEREITSSQSQNSLPSGNVQKEAHIQKSHTFSTSVNEEQVGNISSGIKSFTPTFRNENENKKSEPIYLDPWDLKPIPELDEHQSTSSISSPHKRVANEPRSSIHQEEKIYESLDDIEAYSKSHTQSLEKFAEKAYPALRPHKEEIDDKSKHLYAQVKRRDNLRSSPFNSEDGAITADTLSVTIPKLHIKEHTVDVSLPKTQQKTITETPLSTRKTLSQEEETHKTVPNKSWLRRILNRIKEIFSQGYAALRSIFARSTKNDKTLPDQGLSFHNENGRLNKIKEILSERRPLPGKETGTLNVIKDAHSQKHHLVPGKAGELGKTKEALSQKHSLTPGKAGELGRIKDTLSQKHHLVPGKAGELGKTKEALSQKHHLVPGKAGELGKTKEALSQKHTLMPGKTGELSKTKEALSEKLPLLQDSTMGLSQIKETLSEKGFRVHHMNDEQNKAQNNLHKTGYAFSIGTEHDRIKSILTREHEIAAKLRESGMKEEQNRTCVPSLGCDSHLRPQASRVV